MSVSTVWFEVVLWVELCPVTGYVDALTHAPPPLPVNMVLFGNRALADVIILR